ncbi:MAG: ABC transporter ATP-binding protein [Elusimicrobia bacterium]|nr:ABC transporter ATP-binding protein [Elusimicrobiota bacterium]
MDSASVAVNYECVGKVYSRSHLGRVTKTIGLENFSLKIFKGEIFGMLGLNGAGKTTAMKLACGLLRLTSGNVSVLGYKAGTEESKRKIGYLPELPYFYPYLNPCESLSFYGKLSGIAGGALKTRIGQTLEITGLAAHKNKKVSEFSKGMLQRLGFAQAILHEPEILILDEPVSGLDPLAVHDFREALCELNKSGKTIFLSSHSISEVEKICHRATILKGGRLSKILSNSDWQGEGGLEKIFVDTVKK